MGNVEGALMKALQARKKSTSTQLTIEPETSSPQQSVAPWSGFVNKQLDFHDESDVISALSYIVPYLSKGNPEDEQSALLLFDCFFDLNMEMMTRLGFVFEKENKEVLLDPGVKQFQK